MNLYHIDASWLHIYLGKVQIKISRHWKLMCWIKHDYITHQHNIRADENDRDVFVIAFKVCKRCAKSKLVHLLE